MVDGAVGVLKLSSPGRLSKAFLDQKAIVLVPHKTPALLPVLSSKESLGDGNETHKCGGAGRMRAWARLGIAR
jgi:hypothetical protein